MTRTELAAAFQHWKIGVIDGSGLAKDALHIYIGLAIFIAVRLVWRWRGGWFIAWAAALAAALTGEWIDMGGEALSSTLQPGNAHWHDVWNTMFWPTVLLIVGRWLQPAPKRNDETLAPTAEADRPPAGEPGNATGSDASATKPTQP